MNRVRKQLGITDSLLPEKLSGCIAIVDSGIAPHEDLSGQIIDHIDFSDDYANLADAFGHGTHVAGICAGTGKVSGGLYKGIAPGAKILDIKVLDQKGKGKSGSLVEALTWLYRHIDTYQIKVINISINVQYTEDLQSVYQLCKSFFDAGILVVASAGNMGPREMTISVIADTPYVITVGCNDGPYRFGTRSCKEISGRGPGVNCREKPDLVAPGTEICSLSNRGNGYVRKTGTSMATPIVSGFAYCMMNKFPDMSLQQIIYRMYDTTTKLEEPIWMQGHGMIHARCLNEWNYW